MRTLNIASSFAKALLMCLESETRELNTDEQILEKELTRLSKDFGLVKNIIDILFNRSAKREKIYDLQAAIKDGRREILALDSHRSRLEKICSRSE